jgi:hypothetical protein
VAAGWGPAAAPAGGRDGVPTGVHAEGERGVPAEDKSVGWLLIACIRSGIIRAAAISSKKRQHARCAEDLPSPLPPGRVVVKKRGGGGGSSRKATPSGMHRCGSAATSPAESGGGGVA